MCVSINIQQHKLSFICWECVFLWVYYMGYLSGRKEHIIKTGFTARKCSYVGNLNLTFEWWMVTKVKTSTRFFKEMFFSLVRHLRNSLLITWGRTVGGNLLFTCQNDDLIDKMKTNYWLTVQHIIYFLLDKTINSKMKMMKIAWIKKKRKINLK